MDTSLVGYPKLIAISFNLDFVKQPEGEPPLQDRQTSARS